MGPLEGQCRENSAVESLESEQCMPNKWSFFMSKRKGSGQKRKGIGKMDIV